MADRSAPVPTGQAPPVCETPAACAVMQREGVCCRQKTQCDPQEVCCAKQDANGNVHVACALPNDCMGDQPVALVCQVKGSTDPNQCGEGRTCTDVALNHGLYRCSN